MREVSLVPGAIVLGCLILCACAENQPPPPTPVASGSVAAPQPMSRVASVPAASRNAPVAAPSIVPGSLQDFQMNVGDRVFFSFDSANLDDPARQTLGKEALWLKRFPNVQVAIQGNCDERGTREYNLALGARRAEAVKEYLTVAGVSAARLTTISFGKEKPVCSESNEACWTKNRRAVSVISNLISPNVAMR